MRSPKTLPSITIVFFLAVTTCAAQTHEPDAAIRSVLADQETAWNEGDIDGFMEGYWKSDSLRFASGGNLRKGWQATRDRYHANYPDRATMGKLTFTIFSVDIIAGDHAFVFGRYDLEREIDHPNGLFTLLFRRFDDGWKIVFDHTSANDSEKQAE